MVSLLSDGTIKFAPSFHQQNIDERLSQLGDWLDDLQIMYEAALVERYGSRTFPFQQMRKIDE